MINLHRLDFAHLALLVLFATAAALGLAVWAGSDIGSVGVVTLFIVALATVLLIVARWFRRM